MPSALPAPSGMPLNAARWAGRLDGGLLTRPQRQRRGAVGRRDGCVNRSTGRRRDPLQQWPVTRPDRVHRVKSQAAWEANATPL
jgi:hypothetical protein